MKNSFKVGILLALLTMLASTAGAYEVHDGPR